MPNRKLIILLSLLLAGSVAAPGDAAKIYKWTDEQGNISYHDRPPPGDTGTLEEKDIDPDRNVIKIKIPASGREAPRVKTGPAASQNGGEDVEQDESKRPKERRRRSPAEQAAAAAGERNQQDNVAPGSSIPGSGVTSGPAVPGAPPPPAPPTPGPGGS